jgi:LacI family transcriptional regulator
VGEAGYALLLASSDQQPEREIEALSILRTRQVDGVILYACDQDHPSLRAAVRDLDVPSVLLDRDMPSRADRIYSDHRSAMHEAVRRLVDLGHRRMILLQYDMRIRPSLERRAAFLEVIEEAGIVATEGQAIRLPLDLMTLSEIGAALLDGDPAPTAVIVEGSRLLLATIQAARLRGLAIPAQLSVIAIDAADVATAATPEISCILRDFESIGTAAADTMLARLKDRDSRPSATHLPSRFVEQPSLAPPPPS